MKIKHKVLRYILSFQFSPVLADKTEEEEFMTDTSDHRAIKIYPVFIFMMNFFFR